MRYQFPIFKVAHCSTGFIVVELYSTSKNPIPSKPWVGSVLTEDGIQLRAARWKPVSKNRSSTMRGTVCIVQGRGECIEFYFESIVRLRRLGFHVVAFDLRGQGGSQRLLADVRKGHVDNFYDYQRDVSAIVTYILPQCPPPYFALAHSIGATVLLNMAQRLATDKLATETTVSTFPFSRMVLVSPNIHIRVLENRHWTQRLAKTLAHIGLGRSYIPAGGATASFSRPFDGNPLTSDHNRYIRNGDVLEKHPFLGIGDPTLSWLAASLKATDQLHDPRLIQTIRVPCLVFAAGQDMVVSTSAIESFSCYLPVGHLITLASARHAILHETDSTLEAFWAAFEAFLPKDAL